MLLTDRSHERERLVERIDMEGVADKFMSFFLTSESWAGHVGRVEKSSA